MEITDLYSDEVGETLIKLCESHVIKSTQRRGVIHSYLFCNEGGSNSYDRSDKAKSYVKSTNTQTEKFDIEMDDMSMNNNNDFVKDTVIFYIIIFRFFSFSWLYYMI